MNHFPLRHKSGAARANDLMYPDRISFSPPAFLSLPFHCGSLKKGSKWRLTLPQVAATAPRSSPPCCTCVTLARILSLVCTVLLYSPPGTHFCEKVLNKTFRRNNDLLLSPAFFFFAYFFFALQLALAPALGSVYYCRLRHLPAQPSPAEHLPSRSAAQSGRPRLPPPSSASLTSLSRSHSLPLEPDW